MGDQTVEGPVKSNIRKLASILAFTLDISIGTALGTLTTLAISDAQARKLMLEYVSQGFEVKKGKVTYKFGDKELTKKKNTGKKIWGQFLTGIQNKKKVPYFLGGALAGGALARTAGKRARRKLFRRTQHR